MMKSARLTVLTNQDGLGFKIDSTPGDEPGTPTSIAHDLVEHVNGLEAIGTIGDELMALGAMWKCRGQWGDMQRTEYSSNLTAQQYIAGELPELYYQYRLGTPFGMKIPDKCVIKKGGENFTQEYQLWNDDIAEEGIKVTRGDWMDNDLWSIEIWDEFISRGSHLFIAGMLKFSNIWEGDYMRANSQFWAIHEEVQTALNLPLLEGAFSASPGDYMRANSQFWAIHEEVQTTLHLPLLKGERYTIGYGDGTCSIIKLKEDEY